jgi:hypothetical protein
MFIDNFERYRFENPLAVGIILSQGYLQMRKGDNHAPRQKCLFSVNGLFTHAQVPTMR